MADEGLEGAIRLVQQGQPKEAHVLLEKIVNADVHNVTAWFWYAKTSTSARERTRILETCLRYNPDDLNTRTILGMAPEAQPMAASNPSEPAPNSLVFKASGVLAAESDSSESTKPIKSFVPTPPRDRPAATPRKSRVPAWVLVGAALVFLAICTVAGWIVYQSFP